MLGLFSGELIIGGANYWRKFCVSKWFGLDNENSLNHQGKQPKTGKKKLTLTVHGLVWGGGGGGGRGGPGGRLSVIGRIFASEIWGLIFWRVYFWRGLLSEFYGIFLKS